VTLAEYTREGLAARPDESGTGIPASRTAFDDLADQAARLPWCWPALLTLVLGLYQMGRPELWRDELASWSFASRPASSLIASAHHTGATQLAYYLLLHFWMTVFGDSADAMRTSPWRPRRPASRWWAASWRPRIPGPARPARP
jgi:mannosyltransferase